MTGRRLLPRCAWAFRCGSHGDAGRGGPSVPRWKAVLRGIAYRLILSRGRKGVLHREFEIAATTSGTALRRRKLVRAPYCTVDRVAGFSAAGKNVAPCGNAGCGSASTTRRAWPVFFGKLIPKKDPGLILDAIGAREARKIRGALCRPPGNSRGDLRRARGAIFPPPRFSRAS